MYDHFQPEIEIFRKMSYVVIIHIFLKENKSIAEMFETLRSPRSKN
jgi:hypothetical protein